MRSRASASIVSPKESADVLRIRNEEPATMRAGLSVLLLDTKQNNPNHYIILGILGALRRSPRVGRVSMANYGNAMTLAREHAYDLCLAVDGENTAVEIIAALRPLVGAMALWCFEDPYERETTSSFAHLFDLVFTNDIGSVGAYAAGAIHLPLAASTEFDERAVRESDQSYQYDVAFVGSAWPNRVLLLRQLLAALPLLRWKIVLQYNEFLPPAFLDLPESTYVGAVSHYDFIEIANRSRVNLSLHRAFSGDGQFPRALNPGPRVFELGLAGGFQLIDRRETDVASYYEAVAEVDTFSEVGECVEKIGLYLGQSAQRIDMALAAQRRVRGQHLYKHRTDVILDAFEGLDRLRRPAVVKAPDRPRLLFVTHNTVAYGNFGGVEVYQDTIAQQFRDKYEIFYYRAMTPSSRADKLEFVVTNAHHDVLGTYFTSKFDTFLHLTHPEAEAVFSELISSYRFDLIHFQHLINHCVSLPIIARMLGVPSVYTSQDFYLVCTRYNLIDYRDVYCDIANKPVTVCDNCLHSAENKPRGSQGYRRAFMSRVLSSFDRIIANTPSAQAVLAAVYPELLERKAFVPFGLPVPHTMPSLPRPSVATKATASAATPLRVVWLGNFTRNKGADVLLRAADALKDESIEFTICGRMDEPYPEIIKLVGLPSLTVEGGFLPGQVDLSRFDISLHLSKWPETYCITLSEAWKAGLVPVVTDVGALGDRVKDGVNGFTIPIEGVGELVQLLLRLSANRRELDEVKSKIGPDLWLTPKQHCIMLAAVYDSLIKSDRKNTAEVLKTRGLSSLTLNQEGRPVNSHIWVNPRETPGPALPNPHRAQLTPLARETTRVKAEIASSSFNPFLNAEAEITEFSAGGRIMPMQGGFYQIKTGISLALTGRFRMRQETDAQCPVLALRSFDGDLVLRTLSLHHGTDLRGKGPHMFTSFPISPDMLWPGVYALEMITLRTGKPRAIAMLGSIFSNTVGDTSGPRALVLLNDTTRVPSVIDPWQGREHRSHVEMVGRVDHLDVVEMPDEHIIETPGNSISMFWRLSVAGWLAESNNPISPLGVMLRLTGPETYYLPLEQEARSDMMPASNLSHDALVGYRGKMWLYGVAPGQYVADLLQLGVAGIATHRLSEFVLHVGASVDKGARERIPATVFG